MPSFIQRSFAGGEISPDLFGRADMTKYATGLALCENFRVQKQGGIAANPGTVFIGKAPNVGGVYDEVVLIPFVFNNEITYVLEFSALRMRIIDGESYVTLGGSIYEIETPFGKFDIKDIKFAQSGDVMTIVHPNHPPQEIKRLGLTSWSLDAAVFGPKTESGFTVSIGLSTSATGSNSYRYAVTAVDENGEESEPKYSSLISDVPELDDTNYMEITVTAPVTPTPGATEPIEYNIYRSKNGSEFFLVDVALAGTSGAAFLDKGFIETDVQIPRSKNPFQGLGNYPSTVCFYQQRRVFAASNNEPEKVWMSKVGNYSNFNTSRPIQDDDAVTFTLAGRRFNRIQHLVNVGRLIALTNDGEWLIAGDAAGAITPTSINAQQEGYSGAYRLEPQLVGNNALYIQARGNIVRNLIYEFQSDSYSGQDLTVFATHLFKGRTIVDWAYQQTPDSIVWIVLDNGELVGLTYLPEHDVWGWHRHKTDGLYEGVCVIPNGDIDVVYLVVKRDIPTQIGEYQRYIELMRNPASNIVDAFHVHCGATYDGRNGITPGATMSLYFSGSDLIASSSQANIFQNSEVGDGVVFYNFDIELRCRIEEVISDDTVRVSPSYTVTQEMISQIPPGGTTDWAVGKKKFQVTAILGKTLSILADGNVISRGDPSDPNDAQYTGTGGIVELPDFYVVVHIGLPYECKAKTLRLENVGGETIVNRKKIVNKVTVMYESATSFDVGPSFEKMNEVRMKQTVGAYTPQLFTDEAETVITASWEKNAVTCISHKDPTPLTIQAIIPTGIVGGT